MQIDRIDHLVLTVKDVDKSVEFYTNIMGMKKVKFGENRIALCFGNQKINLHQLGAEFEPKARNAKNGSADLCFIAKKSIKDIKKELIKKEIAIILGPIKRTGALGDIVSIYFEDPDGNLIEVSNYIDL